MSRCQRRRVAGAGVSVTVSDESGRNDVFLTIDFLFANNNANGVLEPSPVRLAWYLILYTAPGCHLAIDSRSTIGSARPRAFQVGHTPQSESIDEPKSRLTALD